jgi:hypothetical protein
VGEPLTPRLRRSERDLSPGLARLQRKRLVACVGPFWVAFGHSRDSRCHALAEATAERDEPAGSSSYRIERTLSMSRPMSSEKKP